MKVFYINLLFALLVVTNISIMYCNVIISTLDNSNIDNTLCLSLSSLINDITYSDEISQFYHKYFLVAINCIDIIDLKSNRELLYITQKGLIKPYNNYICLQVSNISDYPIFDFCYLENYYKDNRTKWNINKNQIISITNNLCLTVSNDRLLSYNYYTLNSSSELNDENHNINNMNLSNNKYWASEPTTKNVVIEIKLNLSLLISDILINWQFTAKHFEIYDINNNLLYRNTNNFINFSEIKLKLVYYNYFKLVMLESSSVIKLTNNQNLNIYGISTIKLLLHGRIIKLSKCSEDENKFSLNKIELNDSTESNYYILRKDLISKVEKVKDKLLALIEEIKTIKEKYLNLKNQSIKLIN